MAEGRPTVASSAASPSSSSPNGVRTPTTNVPPSKAPRASRACASCNRQKLRCDGGRPCSRCTTSGLEESCEYLPSLRGKTRRKKTETERIAKRKEREPDESESERLGSSSRARGDPGSSAGNQSRRTSDLWGLQAPPNQVIKHQPSPIPAVKSSAINLLSPEPTSSTRWSEPPEKLTTLPLPGDSHNPLAVLAEASASALPERGEAVASGGQRQRSTSATRVEEYYAPLERPKIMEAPHIMNYITIEEAETLFGMYFQYLHPHLPFLDRQRSTPPVIARRNNFLFNAICCVSAQACDRALWGRLKEFARYEMERLPRDKNVDVVQGHLLYATWNLIRPKNFEQDQSWIRVGLAVRLAIDINLHRVALIEQARSGLPTWLLRTLIRTWLLAYITDQTSSTQLGKPGSSIADNVTRVYRDLIMDERLEPTGDDIWVGLLAEWTQILVRCIDAFRTEGIVTRSGDADLLSHQQSYHHLIKSYKTQFLEWRDKAERLIEPYSRKDDTRLIFPNIGLYQRYATLILQSFAVGRSTDLSDPDLPVVLTEFESAATSLIHGFEIDFERTGYLYGCPDFVFTVLTYAAVSLLKVLKPRTASIATTHSSTDRQEIIDRVRRTSDMLFNAAMSPDQLPASQSAFLSRLIQPTPNSNPRPPISQPMDYQAFGQMLDQDAGNSLWPPLPSTVQTSGMGVNLNPTNGTAQNPNQIHGAAQDADAQQQGRPMDLDNWVAQSSEYALSGATIGVGLGNFAYDPNAFADQDMFWKSIFEGAG